MREIVLDTETTGLSPNAGHRIVEIACLELENHVPTGREFQTYIDPERDMPPEAERVHGLSAKFLQGQPLFAAAAESFLDFIGDDPLIIHNAEFDLAFLNAELGRLDRTPIPVSRAIDTVHLARRKYPGAQASLDALCRRFEIDLSVRGKHGALVDVYLLAQVYLELLGGKQPSLGLAAKAGDEPKSQTNAETRTREPRPHAPSEAERAAHDAHIARLKAPIWKS